MFHVKNTGLCYTTAMNSSQEYYNEWKSAVQMRESLEADYVAALRTHDWPRIFEIRHYWLTEARDYCAECLALYRTARRAEKRDAKMSHNVTLVTKKERGMHA